KIGWGETFSLAVIIFRGVGGQHGAGRLVGCQATQFSVIDDVNLNHFRSPCESILIVLNEELPRCCYIRYAAAAQLQPDRCARRRAWLSPAPRIPTIFE